MTHSNGHIPPEPIDPCKSQVPVLGAFYKSKSRQSAIGRNFKNLIIKGDHTVQLHHLLDPLIEMDEKSQVGDDQLEIDKIIEDQLCRLYEDYYEISHCDEPYSSTEDRNDSYGFPCVDFEGIFDLAGYSQSIEEAIMSGDMAGPTTHHPGETEEDDFSNVAFMDMSNPMSRYQASHRLWEPCVYGSSKSALDEAYTERKLPAGTDYKVCNDNGITSDHFFSYLHSEPQLTESPMPGLYLHTTVGVDSSLYTIAGTRSIYSNHTATSDLELLLKNKIRVSASGRIDFPLPLNSDILNSAVMIPNDLCYIMSLNSHVIKVIDLREVYLTKKRSRELSGRSKGEDKSVMMERGLMGMSGDALSGRYILYYGGFVLGRTVEKHETDPDPDPVIEVSFHIKANQYIYVLDIQTLEVQRFGLYTNDHRDNYALNESLIKGERGNRRVSFMPNRFGHTSNAVNISQRSRDRKKGAVKPTATDHEEITGTLSELTATVYIIGGYGIKYDAESKRYSFDIIDDMWKLEMQVKSKGKNESLSFAEEVSASAINWKPTDDIYRLMASKDVSAEHREMLDKVDFGVPQPRAFHITELLDTKLVFGQHQNDNLFARTSGIVSSVQTERSTLAAVRHHVFFSSERKSQLKLLMHGGVNADGSVLGDFWWFDFEQEMWFRLKSYFVEDEEEEDDKDKQETQEAQLRKCGHKSFVFDKYLVIVAGASPADLNLSDNPSSEGVTAVFTKLDRRPTDRLEPQSHFYNIFVMDIHDQKWFVYKIFHSTGPRRVPSQIGHSEEAAAAAAAAADTDGVEFNFSYSNLLGGTTTVSDSRLVFIGGICVENFDTDARSSIDSSFSSEQQGDSKQIIILNNSLVCIEFPLGSFSSSENIRNRKY